MSEFIIWCYILLVLNFILDTKRFVCEICGKVYVRAGSYYTHLREHGNDLPKEHKCMICVKSFDTVDELKQHLATHKNESKKLFWILLKGTIEK